MAQGNCVDLAAILEKLLASLAHYQELLNQAFNFKVRTGADYSDFTDRFDEYVRSNRELKASVKYVEQIIEKLG